MPANGKESSTPTQAYCFHMNEVFANCRKEDDTYPLTTEEIAEAQWADVSLKHLFKCNAAIDQGLESKLIENTTCVCKDGWLVIPKPLQCMWSNGITTTYSTLDTHISRRQ